MAATPIVGNTGTISVTDGAPPEILLNARAWSANWVREDFDSTVFGATARATLTGLHKMTGSIEGFVDSITPFAIADFVKNGNTFVLTSSTGRTYGFSGVLSNFSPSSEVGQLNRWTASFESDGPITTA